MALILGDYLEKLKSIESSSVDMIYLDPPFFTQKKHLLTNKENDKIYSFEDSVNGKSFLLFFWHFKM